MPGAVSIGAEHGDTFWAGSSALERSVRMAGMRGSTFSPIPAFTPHQLSLPSVRHATSTVLMAMRSVLACKKTPEVVC